MKKNLKKIPTKYYKLQKKKKNFFQKLLNIIQTYSLQNKKTFKKKVDLICE